MTDKPKTCIDCKIEYPIAEGNFQRKNALARKDQFDSYCKACRSIRNNIRIATFRKDPKLFITSMFPSYRSRAKRENLQFDLTLNHVIEQWNNQAGICFYTAQPIDFTFTMISRNRPHNQTPSLDRLDPDKGYTIGNVVWCAWVINRMKNDLSYDQFLETCSLVSKVRGEYDVRSNICGSRQ